MSKIDDIKLAVAQLSPEEMKAFRDWFEELQEQLWDQQIERDEKAGKLEGLQQRALENLRAGRVRDL